MKAELWQRRGPAELVIGKKNEAVADFFLPVLFKTACKCGALTNFHRAAGDNAKKKKKTFSKRKELLLSLNAE